MSDRNAVEKNKKSSGAKKAVLYGLSASVLAYCGYKIVKNRLVKSKYDPDPNKPLQK